MTENNGPQLQVQVDLFGDESGVSWVVYETSMGPMGQRLYIPVESASQFVRMLVEGTQEAVGKAKDVAKTKLVLPPTGLQTS